MGAPGGSSPAPGAVHTVAILPLTNASGSTDLEWLRAGLPEMLVTDLAQSRYVRAVPGERVARLLQEAGLDQQSRFDEAALETVSKLAQAQSVLSGQFVESGGRLRLDLNLRRAGTGVPIPVKVEGAAADVFGLVDQITDRIKASLDLSPAQLRAEQDRPLAEVATASLPALRAYQSGLAELRRGAPQAAIPFLKEATAQDPNFAMAFARLALAASEADSARKRRPPPTARSPWPGRASGRWPNGTPSTRRWPECGGRRHGGEELRGAGEPPSRGPRRPVPPRRGPAGGGQPARGDGGLREGGGPRAFLWRCPHRPRPHAGDVGTVGRGPARPGRALQEAADPETTWRPRASSTSSWAPPAGSWRATTTRSRISASPWSCAARPATSRARALSEPGRRLQAAGAPDKALDAQKQALALARETKDREGESSYLVSIGQIHERMGSLDKALASFRESMQIEMERNDAVELANRQDHIAEIYRQKGQYEDALVYLEQARTHLAQSDEKREKAFNFGCIGLVRKAQGLYPQAVDAFLAALPLYKEIGNEESAATVQWDLASVYASQGRYADAYNNLRQSLGVFLAHESHDVPDVRADLAHVLIAVGRLQEAGKELDLAEAPADGGDDGHGGGGHGGGHHAGPSPTLLFGRGEIARFEGRGDVAAKAFEEANVAANQSGQKEVAVRSRVELGRLLLDQGRAENAERLLLRTRQEAAAVRLRPLEAEAAVALAEAQLARGQAEPARRAALDAIDLASKFDGRPVLYRANAVLGDVLMRMKRPAEAQDAYAKAVAALEWIRGSVLPEHAASFVARPDLQAFAKRVAAVLEKEGHGAEAATLGPWLRPAATVPPASGASPAATR